MIDEKHRIIGIDFGTTNSVMAWWNPAKQMPEVIPNAQGNQRTPSIVYYGPQGVVVGEAAEYHLADAESNEDEAEREVVLRSIFRCVKRSIGNRAIHSLPDGRRVRPVDIAVEIFRKLKKDAEELLFHSPVNKAVVTYPASFGPLQRDAIRESAQMAGFEEITMLKEPVAAAMGYLGQNGGKAKGILVYDLGGGTFDLAYVSYDEKEGFRFPLPPSGDPKCGGEDFDQLIYAYWNEQARKDFSSALAADGAISQGALKSCRNCKEMLSDYPKASATFFIDNRPRRLTLERDAFETLIKPLVLATLQLTRDLIAQIEREKLLLDSIVMIGGSTRVPFIESNLKSLLKDKAPERTLYVDHAVALGAALYHVQTKEAIKIETTPARVMVHADKQRREKPLPVPKKNEPTPGHIWVEPVTGMKFVWVPSGSYQMGCGAWDGEGDTDEKPVHEVYVDGFWMGKYPVTQGQWEKTMGNNPSYFKKGNNYPVECVSFSDAKQFIQKLMEAGQQGYQFRLPTEAEWEYACRSGGKPEKYAGGKDVDRVAWYRKNNIATGNASDRFKDTSFEIDKKRRSIASTQPVGAKDPNGLGLFDMCGNVLEWCEDIFNINAYSQHQQSNPIYTSSDSSFRVLRGGSWYRGRKDARCAFRYFDNPANRYNGVGFRLVRIA
jgi:formylglycine-generating enzyme required for sulfatase activity